MSNSEDRCEVSEDKLDDRGKNGMFSRSDKVGRGHKRKASWRVYKDVEGGGTRGHINFTQSK